jgi:hypothetical protein
LDNDNIPSSDSIMSEYQSLEVGDRVPMSANAYSEVLALEPGQHMLVVFLEVGAWPDATWVWELYPVGPDRTRLVSRLRVRMESFRGRVMVDLFEIIMMRKHLLGIKERAEALALRE